MIAGGHWRAYAATPGVEVVAVADPARPRPSGSPRPPARPSCPTSRQCSAAGVDVVSVCTPPPTHADLAVAALEAGLPRAVREAGRPRPSTTDRRHRRRGARRPPGSLMVGHVSRFEPDHAAAKAARRRGPDRRGADGQPLDDDAACPAWSEGGWLADPEQSGGPLLDLGVHSFDYLAWVGGQRAGAGARGRRGHAGRPGDLRAGDRALRQRRDGPGGEQLGAPGVARLRAACRDRRHRGPGELGLRRADQRHAAPATVERDAASSRWASAGTPPRSARSSTRSAPAARRRYRSTTGYAALRTALAALESVRDRDSRRPDHLGGRVSGPARGRGARLRAPPHAWSYARALAASRARRAGRRPRPRRRSSATSVARDFGAPYVADAEQLVARRRSRPSSSAAPRRAPPRSSWPRRTAGTCSARSRSPPPSRTREAMVAACAGAGVQLHTAFVCGSTRWSSRRGPPSTPATSGGASGWSPATAAGRRCRRSTRPGSPTPAQSGGGALIDHSVHLTDVVRHVTGQRGAPGLRPRRALLWDCRRRGLALLSLRARRRRGRRASTPAGRCRRATRGTTTSSSSCSGPRARWRSTTSPSRCSWSVPERRACGWSGWARTWTPAMVEAFAASVRAGEVLDPCANGEDGAAALEVALAGYTSAAGGHAVVLAR